MKALEAIDAATNAYRRQAATWAALRSDVGGAAVPAAGPDHRGPAGERGRAAGVSNAPGTDSGKNKTASSEQGSSHDAQTSKALPAERERFGFPEGFCDGRQAVEPVHRAADRTEV
jgi:hypothetical protein